MELTIDQALQRGIEAHKAGRAQEADRYYTAILNSRPDHADANHNIGVLAVGANQTGKALPFFKKALLLHPGSAQFCLSCTETLISLEYFEEAKTMTLAGNIKSYTKGEIEFSYRHSIF